MTGVLPPRTAPLLQFHGTEAYPNLAWQGSEPSLAYTPDEIKAAFLQLDQPCTLLRTGERVGVAISGSLVSTGNPNSREVLAFAPPILPGQFGDPTFRAQYGLRYAYMAGAMANAIASEEMVIALGKAGMLASFGAAGLPPARLETAIQHIQKALPSGPYTFNLIHSPSEEALERRAVELYLRYGVHVVEASAYLALTQYIVWYRAAGLSLASDGEIQINNRVIAKISRKEVAIKFLEPAPMAIIQTLVAAGVITPLQAELAQRVPMADDITVEADSGGHTDNRPLVSLIPTMLALRDDIQHKYGYAQPVRIGAAGGISTPASTLGAFAMGAAYVVTGSVNQACIEAGTSLHTRQLLAKASMTDVTMAPAADMFEMGVRVQVLKSGTLFALRAAKLYEIYNKYDSIEAIPVEEREKLEKQIFQRDLDDVWDETVRFFSERDPAQIERALAKPHVKMALIFRWYLGLSSRWSNSGVVGREMDYQIWCGPAMGAFNDWTRGTYLADPTNRHVVDIALHLLTGAAYLCRLHNLQLQGMQIDATELAYLPTTPLANGMI